MIGVVLWADRTDNRAVIWCADHGRLAYWDSEDAIEATSPSLDAGDIIRFDLDGDARRRKARNPELVQEQACPNIAERMVSNGGPGAISTPPTIQSAEILPFPGAA